MNIQEDYVSFETAKLLKEKGFKGDCIMDYIDNELMNVYDDDYPSMYELENTGDDVVDAPTLQMAMKWLRKEHNIVCNINIESHNFYYYSIFIIRSSIEAQYQLTSQKPYFETYEEACEAAIKYCLKNLI